MFDPASPLAKAISDVFIGSLIVGGLVFLLVLGLVVYVLLKYGRRADDDGREPEQVTGNPKLEIGWTILPALILVGLFIATVAAMGAADPPKPANAQPEIIVVGHQWWWEYRYPAAGITTANEIRLPVGRRVLVKLEAADVQHNFWIPRLGRKADMYPDKSNLLWLHAEQAGPYLGACSEYCGGQHAWMLVQATALPQAEYDAWIAAQQQAQGTLNSTVSNAGQSGGDPARGLTIFRNNTCVNCHAITGETGPNNVAPNLTHLGQRKTLGTGIVQNNPTNLGRWIRNAAELKPGVLMPAYNFSEQDLRDLVAYLLEEKP